MGKVMTENDILNSSACIVVKTRLLAVADILQHPAKVVHKAMEEVGVMEIVLGMPDKMCVCKVSEDKCKTVGGPSANQPCIFPFKWNGKNYNSCPVDSDDTNETWCSTKTDSNGNHITGQGLWGHCGPKCKKE